MRRRIAVLALIAPAAVARADGPAAVDVSDLPPLPAADDAPSSSATLLAAASAEEDVVVGAAKREQSLGNVASAVTVITADRLRRFGYRTIGEAIGAVAGAYLVDNRLSYSIGIRGLQIAGDFNTRVLVLVDGATINEVWGAYAGIGFDAIVGIDEIARIEVIRGPVSSVYGTNAFFGIINIVTRGAAETPRAWVHAGGHSINGLVTAVGFAAGGVDRQLRGSAQFMDRIGEDPKLPDGGDSQLGSDGSQSFSAGLVGAYDGTFGQIRAVRYTRESPFAPYDVSPVGDPYQQIDRMIVLEGGHTRAVSKQLTVAGRGYASFYRFSDTSPPSEPPTGSPLDTQGDAQVYGGEIRARYELVAPDKLGITAGAEASYASTRSKAFLRDGRDTVIADVPLSFNLEGAYAELDGQPLPWLGFTAGLRGDRHSKLQDKLSPRAALFLARPERYGAKLLYAEGFRNPSAFEGYFHDDADFIADPASLRAEAIRSFEAVVWAKPMPGLSTRLSAFAWDARGIIEALPAPSDMTKLQFQNVTRYVARGLEAEVSYRDSRGWLVFGGGALTRVGTEDEMGSVVYGSVPNAPVVTATAGVSTPRLLGRVHLSSEATLIGERPTRPDQDTGAVSPASPAWVGWNVVAYAPNVRGFDVTVGVRNLIGTRDLMPAPADYDRSTLEMRTVPRVPGEGRELYVKLGYAY